MEKGGCRNLREEVSLWSTPDVPNGGRTLSPEAIAAKGKTAKGKRQVGLENVASLWSMPSGSVANDGEQPETWRARAAVLKEKHGNGNGAGTPLTIQAIEVYRSFLPDAKTGTPGERSSADTRTSRRLNPLFVEWLMGLPIGWTACAPLGTEPSPWLRRMRCALSRLEGTNR
jgi:hypothetical protein